MDTWTLRACMCIRIYIYICMCKCMYMCVYIYTYIRYMHACMHAYKSYLDPLGPESPLWLVIEEYALNGIGIRNMIQGSLPN